MRKLLFRLMALLMASSPSEGETVDISGMVTDSGGAPLAGAVVELELERTGPSGASGGDGKFSLSGAVGIPSRAVPASPRTSLRASLRSGGRFLELPARDRVSLTAHGPAGAALGRTERVLDAGSHGMPAPGEGTGVRFYLVAVEAGDYATLVKGMSLGNGPRAERVLAAGERTALFKSAAGELFDVISATKSGYPESYLSVSKSETTQVTLKLPKTTSPKSSFFVTRMRGLQALAGSDKGFGGDLRFGMTGAGPGPRSGHRCRREISVS